MSEPALVSAGEGQTLLISYRALPMEQELELEVYRRTPQANRRVRLQAAELPGARDASLYLYRLMIPLPVAAPASTSGPARVKHRLSRRCPSRCTSSEPGHCPVLATLARR